MRQINGRIQLKEDKLDIRSCYRRIGWPNKLHVEVEILTIDDNNLHKY
jgi:hypothetical protein